MMNEQNVSNCLNALSESRPSPPTRAPGPIRYDSVCFQQISFPSTWFRHRYLTYTSYGTTIPSSSASCSAVALRWNT